MTKDRSSNKNIMNKIMKTMKMHQILWSRKQQQKLNRFQVKEHKKMHSWPTVRSMNSKNRKERGTRNGIWIWMRTMILYDAFYIQIYVGNRLAEL